MSPESQRRTGRSLLKSLVAFITSYMYILLLMLIINNVLALVTGVELSDVGIPIVNIPCDTELCKAPDAFCNNEGYCSSCMKFCYYPLEEIPQACWLYCQLKIGSVLTYEHFNKTLAKVRTETASDPTNSDNVKTLPEGSCDETISYVLYAVVATLVVPILVIVFLIATKRLQYTGNMEKQKEEVANEAEQTPLTHTPQDQSYGGSTSSGVGSSVEGTEAASQPGGRPCRDGRFNEVVPQQNTDSTAEYHFNGLLEQPNLGNERDNVHVTIPDEEEEGVV